MKVISIRRKQFLGDYPRGGEAVPEGMRFAVAVGLVLLGPTLLYCAVLGHLWPLYVMGLNGAAGAALGVLMFKKSRTHFTSCVPATRVPDIPRGAGGLGLAA
jgi:hypothetical protein